jgi:hypothetical protein
MPSQWAKWWVGESEGTIINTHNREKMERRSKICSGWGNTRATAETTRGLFRTSVTHERIRWPTWQRQDNEHTVSLSTQNMALKLVMYGRSLTVLAIQAQYLIHRYWLHFKVRTTMEMSLMYGPLHSTVPRTLFSGFLSAQKEP